MALRTLFIILAVTVIALGENEVEKEGATKAVATEKEKSRSANPVRERGSLQKLTNLMNRTDDRNRRRGKDSLLKIHQIHKNDNMMNDNEGAVTTNGKPDNDTLYDKMNVIRGTAKLPGTIYEYRTSDFMSQAAGVFCNFENETADKHTCLWQWNLTVSSRGLGFKVATAADVARLNGSSRGLRFSGPATDADGNAGGHFLYLPVDSTMENMVIKSPPFRSLGESCKFEAWLHESKMQNASIKLMSESTMTQVQVIMQEVAGDNYQLWHPIRFMIGKFSQEVSIIIEITRPKYVSVSHPLPHIAVDNIRLTECVAEPPIYNGECNAYQWKCKIAKKDSCIKLNQVCDLVKDCDDGSDENQNCDKMPYGSYCNFESDACGFEDIQQPILKWSRHSGPTPTDKTGPNWDHTCGTPTPHPTEMVPLLIPAHMNQSLSTCIGWYFFVNMNVTGPNKEKADFASTAVMRTSIFNPPPKVHGNHSSDYYNCCMIRFYYYQYGRNSGSIGLDVVEITNRGNITTPLWFSTKNKGPTWYRASIFLPNITRRYFLIFRTRMGMRIYSDTAIDDYSMAPECFGLNIPEAELGDYVYYDPVLEEKTTPHDSFVDQTYYRFSTCGSTGRYGPNQTMCDVAYNNTSVSVSVVQNAPYQGIQVWEVPAEGLYTIIAVGASGGLGSARAGVSHGASVRALLQLHKAEHIYMLVGQQGRNACKKTLSAQEGEECIKRSGNESQLFTSKTHEVRNTHVTDGGGGGGGATYVFVLDKDGQAYPLVVAGGGGGLTVGAFRDDGSQHGRPATNATPESGYMYGQPGKTSGAGGGWMSRAGPNTPGFEVVRGAAVSTGGAGGAACVGIAHGGFGGGGGGCVRGGGGGGWQGGSTHDGQGIHGGGGWSYVENTRALRDWSEAGVASRAGPGEVIIIPALHDCGCDYRCVALNEYRSLVKCYCPSTWSTDAQDPTKCILEDSWPHISWVLVIVLSIAVFVCSLAVLCICLYLYSAYQKKKETEEQERRIMEQDLALHRLRTAPRGNDNPLSMAFNPHYGSEGFLPPGIDVRELPQVSRESLKLVKALGQGAFGEVYQGLYRHRTGDTIEMPVAVKTLPELSTHQAEQDFLLEAAIMAKFNHSNVVHMIGVCFDRHPRFIVIELLVGGDMKTFLRECRPTPEKASALTMKDLLQCSSDVSKGCRYLESRRFIHRDIAARNCLLSSRGPGRTVKIADFGMARDVYGCEYYRKDGKAMLPIKWMPPEAYIDGVFSIKTDVWSFGILLWEVFSLGVMPYTGCNNQQVMEMVSNGGRLQAPTGCPTEVYHLMCECWAPDPALRPTFTELLDKLQLLIQDPVVVNTSLPVMKSHIPFPVGINYPNGTESDGAGDYLVPMSPLDPTNPSSTDPLFLHSRHKAAMDPEELEDSQYQHLLRVSQEYGNIPIACPTEGARPDASVGAAETRTTTKFQPSNSTDRLLSSTSLDTDPESEPESERPVIWETSFIVSPNPERKTSDGPAVDKLISITPTSPKPPENVLSKAIESNVIDKTNHKTTLVPERRAAPIASPDPPRVNAWKEPPKYNKKPLCLDAAQLEQNLNALKKNSGSVNLNTMNILPPYINVVTPNKLSESKTIQIDPKKAVIDDLPKENAPKEEKSKLKPSNSAASLLNGPMTDVPYVDSSDTTSTSSGGTHNLKNQKNYGDVTVGKSKNKVCKQGSKTDYVAEAEISC